MYISTIRADALYVVLHVPGYNKVRFTGHYLLATRHGHFHSRTIGADASISYIPIIVIAIL